MNNTARHYFERAGLGTPVGGTSRLLAAIDAISRTDDAKKISRLAGILLLQAHGRPLNVGRTCRDEHLALARRYGLTAADIALQDGPSVRLDWGLGQLVMKDAA